MRKLTRKQKKILDTFFKSQKNKKSNTELDAELTIKLNKIDSEDVDYVEEIGMITFQGKKYPTRELVILVDDVPEGVLISVGSLNSELLDGDGNYVSDEAQKVDEQIYFFVDDSLINLPDAELARNLDEEYELAPEEE